MKREYMTKNVKLRSRYSKVLPTYGCETWTWNKADSSRNHVAEMSYLRSDCRVSRWDGVHNVEVYTVGDAECQRKGNTWVRFDIWRGCFMKDW